MIQVNNWLSFDNNQSMEHHNVQIIFFVTSSEQWTHTIPSSPWNLMASPFFSLFRGCLIILSQLLWNILSTINQQRTPMRNSDKTTANPSITPTIQIIHWLGHCLHINRTSSFPHLQSLWQVLDWNLVFYATYIVLNSVTDTHRQLHSYMIEWFRALWLVVIKQTSKNGTLYSPSYAFEVNIIISFYQHQTKKWSGKSVMEMI